MRSLASWVVVQWVRVIQGDDMLDRVTVDYGASRAPGGRHRLTRPTDRHTTMDADNRSISHSIKKQLQMQISEFSSYDRLLERLTL